MNMPQSAGDATELCDWCGQALDQTTARYEQLRDPEADHTVVLTACGEDHLRHLRQQYQQS